MLFFASPKPRTINMPIATPFTFGFYICIVFHINQPYVDRSSLIPTLSISFTSSANIPMVLKIQDLLMVRVRLPLIMRPFTRETIGVNYQFFDS